VIVNLALALVNCMDRGTTVLAVKMAVVVDHAWRSLGRWPVCRRWAEPGNPLPCRGAAPPVERSHHHVYPRLGPRTNGGQPAAAAVAQCAPRSSAWFASASATRRRMFWDQVTDRLHDLGVAPEAHARIVATLARKVPFPTCEEYKQTAIDRTGGLATHRAGHPRSQGGQFSPRPARNISSSPAARSRGRRADHGDQQTGDSAAQFLPGAQDPLRAGSAAALAAKSNSLAWISKNDAGFVCYGVGDRRP